MNQKTKKLINKLAETLNNELWKMTDDEIIVAVNYINWRLEDITNRARSNSCKAIFLINHKK
jgi:hypothetical protein